MINPNNEINEIMIIFSKICFKNNVLPFIDLNKHSFSYEYTFEGKIHRGLFFSLNKCENFTEKKKKIFKLNLVQFSQFGSKFIINTYVCQNCIKGDGDELFVHSTRHDIEVFCLHSDYIKDDIYSNII